MFHHSILRGHRPHHQTAHIMYLQVPDRKLNNLPMKNRPIQLHLPPKARIPRSGLVEAAGGVKGNSLVGSLETTTGKICRLYLVIKGSSGDVRQEGGLGEVDVESASYDLEVRRFIFRPYLSALVCFRCSWISCSARYIPLCTPPSVQLHFCHNVMQINLQLCQFRLFLHMFRFSFSLGTGESIGRTVLYGVGVGDVYHRLFDLLYRIQSCFRNLP